MSRPPRSLLTLVSLPLLAAIGIQGCSVLPREAPDAFFIRCMDQSGYRVTNVETYPTGNFHYVAPNVPFMRENADFMDSAYECEELTLEVAYRD